MMNIKILAYDESPLGLLCLRRRELLSQPGVFVTEITLNHEFLMSSYNTASERALSQIALQHHPGQQLRVFVGGLGLGYTAAEVLTSPRVKTVEVVEFLPQVMTWMAEGLVPLAEELNADSRFNVVSGDAYARLLEPPAELYDLIHIDVDHSPEERLEQDEQAPNHMFYTDAGLRLAKQHLAPNGILGIWSYAASSPFSEALQRVFVSVWHEEVTFENNLIDEETTDWLFFARDPA